MLPGYRVLEGFSDYMRGSQTKEYQTIMARNPKYISAEETPDQPPLFPVKRIMRLLDIQRVGYSDETRDVCLECLLCLECLPHSECSIGAQEERVDLVVTDVYFQDLRRKRTAHLNRGRLKVKDLRGHKNDVTDILREAVNS